MTDLVVSIPAALYEQMVADSAADFALIEGQTHGVTKQHVRHLHARAVYIRNLVDSRNGIVRTDDGTDKPPPHP